MRSPPALVDEVTNDPDVGIVTVFIDVIPVKDEDSATVPEVVIVPPVRFVPAVMLVTVPTAMLSRVSRAF